MDCSCQPIQEPGATSDPTQTVLLVTGMNCGNCARKVTDALQSAPGVARVWVKLEDGTATVRWAGEGKDPSVLVRAVEAAGFEVRVEPQATSSQAGAVSRLAGWRFNVVFGGALTVPLLIGDWILGLGQSSAFHWVSFAMATPVLFVCGARFFRGAWRQLRRGQSDMDTLVSLGSSTAYGYSLWALLTGNGHHLYFMEAAAIITLISVGHWLESNLSEKAASAVRALLDLTPPTARRLGPDGVERVIPATQVKLGDLVVVGPGDRLPTDGEVCEGLSAVDESMLTGESLPVEKQPGAAVYAGTLNRSGRLVLRTAATGESTALAQIIAVVQRAQTSRANVQRLADRVSSVFVPIVVLIAVLTALAWAFAPVDMRAWNAVVAAYFWPVSLPETALAAAFVHAAAVLIVACPCAMGLATPAAIMAGANAAARRGILIRDGQALEKSGSITTVVFDKTGTLTRGSVTVAAFVELRPQGDLAASPKELAVALARPSNHPLSLAIAGLVADPTGRLGVSASPASSSAVTLANWREVPGRGIEAGLGQGGPSPSSTVRLGSMDWLRTEGVDLTTVSGEVGHFAEQGATVVGLSVNGVLMAVIALRDQLKEGAAEVVRQLKAQGMLVRLLTGDNAGAAAFTAKELGLEAFEVWAGVRPEMKANRIAALQQEGQRVAFVGDGINDAPALEQADLGIAVGRASDVAREAADVILLNSDVTAIPEALSLAQATLRTIKQNLFWAFFYNAAAIPLAALGLLSPMLCAAAMGFSDVVVIGNALRLLRFGKRR